MLQENFNKKSQGCHSYPSRRRACYQRNDFSNKSKYFGSNASKKYIFSWRKICFFLQKKVSSHHDSLLFQGIRGPIELKSVTISGKVHNFLDPPPCPRMIWALLPYYQVSSCNTKFQWIWCRSRLVNSRVQKTIKFSYFKWDTTTRFWC